MKNIRDILKDATKYLVAIEGRLPRGAPKISTMLGTFASSLPAIPDLPIDLPPLPDIPGAPPTANLQVSNLIVAPKVVQVGQTVTISCTVKNIGTVAGTKTISLGGDFMAQQIVSLQPGESKVVSFEVTPATAKSYSVQVDGLSGTFTATTQPVAPAPDIRVENLVITPAAVYVGEKVTITVTAKNYGTAAGTKTITCSVS